MKPTNLATWAKALPEERVPKTGMELDQDWDDPTEITKIFPCFFVERRPATIFTHVAS